MKIGMIEYQGRCDEKGVAVGHSPKVLGEYYKIAKNVADVSIYAPKTILRSTSCEISKGAKVLPFSIGMTGKKSLFVKILNKIHMFDNLSLAIKNSDDDILWFYNVEYYFWLYIFLHKRINKKIVCTLFINGYEGGIVAKVKQWVFEKAQRKIDYIVGTGASFSYKNVEHTFIPDYVYEADKLEKYLEVSKQDYAVCLGTMDRGKQLECLIDAFNHSGYRLVIAGRFYDKEWYKELCEASRDNIEIIDDYLDDERYKKLLTEAKYCVLPYTPDKYGIQTSGVLQEAVFADTIPVAFTKVLEASGLPGIGIGDWQDLHSDQIFVDDESIIRKIKELKRDVYDIRVIEKQYADIFTGI